MLFSRSFGLNLFLFVIARSQQDITSDELFLDCSMEHYYKQDSGIFVEPTTSWDPTSISDLLRETHRQVLPYTSSSREDVWDALIDLDSNEDKEMIHLIYRDVDVPSSEYGTTESWNREHLWPKSRGVGTSGPDYTDVHALRPSDWNVNAARNNLFFGDCEDSCTSRPAHIEAAADTGRDDNIFLPPTEVRGDIARALFYMAMRYASLDEINTEVLELTDCPDESLSYQMAYLSDLLRWHEEDPPDDAERIRNQRVCSRWQGNRNIFVDYPELATQIFGGPSEKPYDCGGFRSSPPTLSPSATMPSPTPAEDSTTAGCSQLSPGDVQVVSLSSDNPDSIVLVTLTDLPGGLELFITDNAWIGSDFKTNEGTLKLSLVDGLAKGSVFGFDVLGSIPLGDAWESVGGASFALATAGDSVIMYCLDENDASYHHLGGIISGTWAANEAIDLDTDESQKPESLGKVGAIEIGSSWDNLLYVGTTTGTKPELLGALADGSNWEGSNSERLVYSGANFVVEEAWSSDSNPTPMGAGDVSESSSASTTVLRCYATTSSLFLAFWVFLNA